VTFPRLEAIAVGDVNDVLPRNPDARRDVRLLHVHVEEVCHYPYPTTDLLGERHALLQPVYKVLCS
jgi:hypothetical protein